MKKSCALGQSRFHCLTLTPMKNHCKLCGENFNEFHRMKMQIIVLEVGAVHSEFVWKILGISQASALFLS